MRFPNRREFMHDSAWLAAAAASLALDNSVSAEEKAEKAAAARKGPASEKLRVAVVGVNGRGKDHVRGFAGKHNCIVTTICDPDSAVVERAIEMAEDAQDSEPKYVKDIRKVVEDKNIDIVSIATPNHWHALAAIWALQNGKDVYVEKPVSHNVSEGRRIVEAARKYKRICQAGTQSRSSKGMRDAIAYLHDGKLGKVKLGRGFCFKLRPSIGKVKGAQKPPATCDYDLWCGPAPKSPLMRKRLHYDWHWVWETGNGDLGNQGIHEMDKARWGLNKNELCKSVISVGGRFGYVDDGQTANTQICVYDFGDCELIFEVRGWASDSPFPGKESNRPPRGGPKGGGKGGKGGKSRRFAPNFVGNVWYGSEGFLVCPSYTGGIAYSNDGEVLKRFRGGDDHYGNFVKAVRSRRAQDLTADILEGHLSSALCHLGNISYRLGKPQAFSKGVKPFGGDKDAGKSMESMVAHLRKHKIDVDELNYALGRKLTFDPKTESFVGDKEANAMLTREYRKGFEVPAKV
jgi:predicted dehydrogenase